MKIQYNFKRDQEIIDCLIENFMEFKTTMSIPIIFSDKEPPIYLDRIFISGKPRTEKEKNPILRKYPIDRLMGEYLPKKRQIIIYLQGINRAAEYLSKKEKHPNLYDNLLSIVLLHEIGHFWVHNFKNDKMSNNKRFNDNNLSEWIAQVFAFLCLHKSVGAKKVMLLLAKYQPAAYRTFVVFQNLPLNEFKNSIKQLSSDDSKCNWKFFLLEINKYDYLNECIENSIKKWGENLFEAVDPQLKKKLEKKRIQKRFDL